MNKFLKAIIGTIAAIAFKSVLNEWLSPVVGRNVPVMIGIGAAIVVGFLIYKRKVIEKLESDPARSEEYWRIRHQFEAKLDPWMMPRIFSCTYWYCILYLVVYLCLLIHSSIVLRSLMDGLKSTWGLAMCCCSIPRLALVVFLFCVAASIVLSIPALIFEWLYPGISSSRFKGEDVRFDELIRRRMAAMNAKTGRQLDVEDAVPVRASKRTRGTRKKKRQCKSIDEELNSLIGLESVKDDVKNLRAFLGMQKARKSKRLATTDISYHCVFTGNPGTGKTTVARIIAQLYKEMGVVKKGQLIEVDRADLVGRYLGETAPKTKEVIKKAIGGVLFIDEAYALCQGTDEDYGKEAINTLLKCMEDYRDRLVVIVAGYTDEMKQFIAANPGLQSRFTRTINFPDYSIKDLVDIFMYMVKSQGYLCSKEISGTLENVMDELRNREGRNFGNARSVRNYFERVIRRMAKRLQEAGGKPTKMQLQTILPSDLQD